MGMGACTGTRQVGRCSLFSGYIRNCKEQTEAMVRFAFEYDKQTENDYEALVAAIKSGRIKIAKANG
jgi:hypothetical protein